MLVHIFKGRSGLYGFTADKTGTNLPESQGPWTSFKIIELKPGDDRFALNADETLKAIADHGFLIREVKFTFTESVGDMN